MSCISITILVYNVFSMDPQEILTIELLGVSEGLRLSKLNCPNISGLSACWLWRFCIHGTTSFFCSLYLGKPQNVFWSSNINPEKNVPTKLDGKALVAGPLIKELLLRLPLFRIFTFYWLREQITFCKITPKEII